MKAVTGFRKEEVMEILIIVNLDGSWRNSLSRNKRVDYEAMPSSSTFIIDWLIDNYPKAPQPSI